MEVKLHKTIVDDIFSGVKNTLYLLFLLNGFIYSQENFKTKNNNIFIEAFGSGGNYSINFDKTIYQSSNFRDFILVNGSVFYDKWTISQIPNKPKSFYLFYTGTLMVGTENGAGRLKKEIAIGLAGDIGEPIRLNNIRSNLSNNRYQLGLAGVLGLRYYFKKKPIFVKICYSPFYSFPEKRFYPLWGGIGLGINFN